MDNTLYVLVALVFLIYVGYRLFEATKEIRRLPKVPIFSLIRSNILGQSFDELHEQIYKPVLADSGCVRVWIRGKWEIVISDLKQCREIVKNPIVFSKRPENGDPSEKRMLINKFFGSKNVFLSDGPQWRRHRNIVNPALNNFWTNELFGKCSMDLIEKLDDINDKPVNIHPLFQRLTLDALGRGFFSYDFEAMKKGESSRNFKIYNEIMSASLTPIYIFFPLLEDINPFRKYYHEINDEFKSFLLSIIQERKAELLKGIDQSDLLSLIIKASMNDAVESRLSDEEVLQNMITFFAVGHDSTANTLTSNFYFLARYPEIQERICTETFEALDNPDSITVPTNEQLKNMPYLSGFIKESMRLITFVTHLRRYCKTATVLSDGLVVPADTFIYIGYWSIHHNPNLFPDPEKFDPGRFLNSRSAQSQAWLIFGTGPRMCPGLNFSLIEQKIAMVMLLQKYKVSLGPNSSKSPKPYLKLNGLTHPLGVDLCFEPLKSRIE